MKAEEAVHAYFIIPHGTHKKGIAEAIQWLIGTEERPNYRFIYANVEVLNEEVELDASRKNKLAKRILRKNFRMFRKDDPETCKTSQTTVATKARALMDKSNAGHAVEEDPDEEGSIADDDPEVFYRSKRKH
ncbi:hypothetical protein CALCODRAFT_481644 [Calocera cornea HHB12733]|uniref:Uncharacterized protein n=1 Tax=Calocera cornea HHB12733 TaxID=1353952 RepID=A0A165HF93_9BASI|nr:hypothetical protein CALCODRAFT_481644 [Calocera cornea HHB12733]